MATDGASAAHKPMRCDRKLRENARIMPGMGVLQIIAEHHLGADTLKRHSDLRQSLTRIDAVFSRKDAVTADAEKERIASIVNLCFEYDRESDAEEERDILRTLEEISSNEPLEMPVQSIDDWEKDLMRIHLLDDGGNRKKGEFGNAEKRKLAAALGCQYIVGPQDKPKAGNVNSALAQTKAELFCVIDADFVPTTKLLERTVGFFQDPGVALVQTPQAFCNADAVARNLGLEAVVTEDQAVFFRAAQRGRDAVGGLLCHGTKHGDINKCA